MRRPATQAEPPPPEAATPVRARPRAPAWLMAVLLVLSTIAIYWPVTRCDFINYDDGDHVTANVQIQKGLTWESLKWAWLNPVNSIWHPITVWSHMADCQLFALNPWGHHLTSVLLHAVNTGLVFLFLRGLTGALWPSAMVAALFGCHPVHVESVAWVSERKDVLSGCFGLLALMAYVRYAQSSTISNRLSAAPAADCGSLATDPRLVFFFLSLFLFALGLMSKPMLVTWPFVMLLLDYWPLGRMQKVECRKQNGEAGDTQYATRNTQPGPSPTLSALLLEKLPFFSLAALTSVATFLVQQHGGAMPGANSLSLSARAGNTLVSYVRYLGKLCWPTDLAVFYPHPGHWPLGIVVLAGAVLLGASVLAWVARRRSPYSLAGWLWFVGVLFPVIGMVQVGGQAMADRYTYLPSLGVLVLAVWGANELTRGWRYRVLALSVPGGAATLLLLVLTRQQISYWRDSEALFRHALGVTENNYFAHNSLGSAFGKRGETDAAIRQIQEALRLRPGYALAWNNLGVELGKKGEIDGAIRQFREALRLKPDYAEAHYDLSVALTKKGRTDEAIRELRETIRLKPAQPQAHNDLGAALYRQGRTGEAIRQFQEALRLKPDYAEAHYDLGIAFYQQRRAEEAVRQFQEALKLKPDFAAARRNLDAVLAYKARSPPPSSASTNR